MSEQSTPRLGQFVKVLRGRDAGKLAVIIGIEESRYVNIADGDKRKFDQPKRKTCFISRCYPRLAMKLSEVYRRAAGLRTVSSGTS